VLWSQAGAHGDREEHLNTSLRCPARTSATYRWTMSNPVAWCTLNSLGRVVELGHDDDRRPQAAADTARASVGFLACCDLWHALCQYGSRRTLSLVCCSVSPSRTGIVFSSCRATHYAVVRGSTRHLIGLTLAACRRLDTCGLRSHGVGCRAEPASIT
jgi:hypothetical protein